MKWFRAPLIVLVILCLLLQPNGTRGQGGTTSLGINGFNCVVTVSTATTIQAVGGSCVAPGPLVRLYITDIEFGSSVAPATFTADVFPTLKTGTGGTCGTNTSVIWQAMIGATSTVVSTYTTPIRLPLNQELCWIMSQAGSKTLQVHGYIAP